MSLSKSLIYHLRVFTISSLHRPLLPSPFVSLRFLSFATPEEAAAERRRRKRRLRIEPPLSSLNRSSQSPTPSKPPSSIPQNPNSPKLPEPVSSLTGNRLNLHNRILTLIRENDLEEAALLTRHSIYSNCRPTIFTANAVLQALIRQSKYSDFLSLHRFITQAGLAPNVITYNLLFQTYLDCRRPDTAMEHYKQFINDAPINPSLTTYRILIKGLVDNNRVERALELAEEMCAKGFSPDPLIYHYLMVGCAKNSDADGIFKLYEDLKEKLGGVVEDGIVYGGLMKGYFIRGMELEAMDLYQEAVGPDSKLKMSAIAYNSILDALSKNGKFEEAISLFDRILSEHGPPRRLSVNLGTFNVMVDGYCSQKKFKEAIDVFQRMGDYRVGPDVLSYNNLIDQLCANGMLPEAEDLYKEMSEKKVHPDEYTNVLLMDACFKENRSDDAAGYFTKMIGSGLRPNVAVYSKLVEGLVKVGKVNEAKSFYDLMVKKLKMDNASYKFMMQALGDVGKFDEVLGMVDQILDDEEIEFDEELQEFAKEELRKGGREDDLGKLMEEKERLKAEAKAREVEAAEAAKRSVRAAVASLIPSKLNVNKEGEKDSTSSNIEESSAKKEENDGDSSVEGAIRAEVS
ncbi:hypothetical protein SAY87_030177 [Trapa incisa]|uniref:Pentatricopeptide repeat-containing protein n=1 Tax=Trapa incisa TaxID=236973 RepID=A0AAN7KD29_9MYRT|nr:hypothetical protein SAY87_030177 [Trapa incisa]